MFLSRARLPLAVLLVALPFSASAQRTAKPNPKTTAPKPQAPPTAAAPAKPDVTLNWETLKPENEEFSILMPKDTSTEIGKFDYHRFQLNTRLYLSAPTASPVVGVVSMSGIKSNPASASDLERFNSYADAFKNFFVPKVRKDVPPKMVLTATKPFHGYTARVYTITVGDLTGRVNAVITKKRFYAVAVLNTQKDDVLEDKFLSSFVIPDRPIDQPNVATNEETLPQEGIPNGTNNQPEKPRLDGRKPGVAGEGVAVNGANQAVNTNEDNTEFGSGTTQPSAQQANPNQQQANQKRPPVNGGMLNGKAIYLPSPEMPPGEKAGGVVLVQILVDEGGTVIDAKPVSGPPSLHAAAVNAARFARFTPTMLMGEPVRVQGTLAYNFARSN